jgi:ribonucleoside-diphosphate reductase alpha chain
VGDSIEGWADAVKVLVNSYLNGKPKPRFDYSDIREKGAPLITSGGKAPGPQPLKDCIHNLEKILESVPEGGQLTTINCHDMVCYIADAVLSVGIRRAACIALFDIDDTAMLTCKFGNWWELNPQRARSNNSAVIMRNKITKPKFDELWERVKESQSGEPGILFTNNKELGTNPCGEVSLKPFQMCNLTEINMSDISSQEDFNERCRAASFIGTLQAGYTDFHYLRPVWKTTTEKDALIGVGMTGLASNAYLKVNIEEGAREVNSENTRVAELIGINKASRSTVIKPSGTTSIVVGSSSGIHAWHSQFYIRHVRFNKNEPIAQYLMANHPELVEDEFFKPDTQIVVKVPQRAPDGATTRDTESALDMIERIVDITYKWILPGHLKGDNYNNVSATVTVKDSEWVSVRDEIFNHRNLINGISVLPYDDHTYKQAPFETIDKATYETMEAALKYIDLTNVIESNDNTDHSSELSCAGGTCEIT